MSKFVLIVRTHSRANETINTSCFLHDSRESLDKALDSYLMFNLNPSNGYRYELHYLEIDRATKVEVPMPQRVETEVKFT